MSNFALNSNLEISKIWTVRPNITRLLSFRRQFANVTIFYNPTILQCAFAKFQIMHLLTHRMAFWLTDIWKWGIRTIIASRTQHKILERNSCWLQKLQEMTLLFLFFCAFWAGHDYRFRLSAQSCLTNWLVFALCWGQVLISTRWVKDELQLQKGCLKN